MFIVLDMKADKLNSLFKCIRRGSVEQSKEFVSSSVKSIILLSSRDRPFVKRTMQSASPPDISKTILQGQGGAACLLHNTIHIRFSAFDYCSA